MVQITGGDNGNKISEVDALEDSGLARAFRAALVKWSPTPVDGEAAAAAVSAAPALEGEGNPAALMWDYEKLRNAGGVRGTNAGEEPKLQRQAPALQGGRADCSAVRGGRVAGKGCQ